MANNLMLNFPRITKNVIINHVQRRYMPVNVPPTATGKRRFRFEVETDPHKLVNYCCGLNYHIDEPPIKLKPDNEYPDWLWNLRMGPKPNSWELEKGTKEYYLRLAEENIERNDMIRKTAAKKTKVVGKHLLDQQEYKHKLRFAALAHMEEDAGFDSEAMERDWWSSMMLINKRDYYLPVNENKVIYKDKIEGNIKFKNYYNDPESTFRCPPKSVKPPLPKTLKAIQDSRRRHRYTGT